MRLAHLNMLLFLNHPSSFKQLFFIAKLHKDSQCSPSFSWPTLTPMESVLILSLHFLYFLCIFSFFLAITHFFSFTILALIFLDKYPKVGLLHNMIVLFLIFWRTTVSHSDYTIFAFPTQCTSVQSLLILTSTCYFCFYNSHSDRFEVKCHCGFELHSHDD